MTDQHDWAAWSHERPELTSTARKALRRELGKLRPTTAAPVAAARIPASRLASEAETALRAAVGPDGDVATDHETRARHAGGQALVDLLRRRAGDATAAPDAVVRPADTQAVAAVLRAATEHRLAVIPWGGGTSVVGGLDPVTGEQRAVVALDLSRLDRLLAVDDVSMTATFEPGILTPEAEVVLAQHGLMLGHLPQSFERASLGGYVVTRSAGQASSGVGRIDDLLVGATMVTPTGELRLPAVPGSAAGPDLRRLVLGSEGTLGVVTEVTLRVRRMASVKRYEAWLAPTWELGQAALRELAQDGRLPDVLRLSDPQETRLSMTLGSTPPSQQRALRTLARLRRINPDDACLVIAGWEGDRHDINHRRKVAHTALRAIGGIAIGRRAGESWRRHRFSGPALRDSLLDAGVAVETLETAALWSRLPQVDAAVRASLTASIPGCRIGCHVSHLYPTGASLYFTVLFRLDDDPQRTIATWTAAKGAVTEALVAAGGTASHHHAVGTMHRPAASTDLGGPLGPRILAAVKSELDPAGILNPGKLIPDPSD